MSADQKEQTESLQPSAPTSTPPSANPTSLGPHAGHQALDSGSVIDPSPTLLDFGQTPIPEISLVSIHDNTDAAITNVQPIPQAITPLPTPQPTPAVIPPSRAPNLPSASNVHAPDAHATGAAATGTKTTQPSATPAATPAATHTSATPRPPVGNKTRPGAQPQQVGPPSQVAAQQVAAQQVVAQQVVAQQVAPSPPPAAARPQPEWKELEPTDQSDPVRHQLHETVRYNPEWEIHAASVRGKLHAHKGLWREDSFAHGSVGPWTFLLVADGAGSARLARIGSQVACREALATLLGLFDGFLLADSTAQLSNAELMRVRVFLAEAARKAQLGLLREAQRRHCGPKDFNTTFLLVAHCPWRDSDFVGALQVGDGAVGLLTDDDTCTLLGVADHGEYSSETRFLTTAYIEHEFDQRVLFSVKKGMKTLAVMCDGVSDDFFPESSRLLELFLGNPIRELKSKTGAPVFGLCHEVLKAEKPADALLEWLKYEKKGSSDDRTLLVMHRSNVQ